MPIFSNDCLMLISRVFIPFMCLDYIGRVPRALFLRSFPSDRRKHRKGLGTVQTGKDYTSFRLLSFGPSIYEFTDLVCSVLEI